MRLTTKTNTQDYHAFGSVMAGRSFSNANYRFGFNNQEQEKELGEYYAFEYRIHDARLCRFLSVDPLSAEYPWNSSYAFAENRVIDGIDLEGKEYTSAIGYTFLKPVIEIVEKSTLKTLSGATLITTAVLFTMINQASIIINEGAHEGSSYSKKSEISWATVWVINDNWEFQKRKDLGKENISFEKGCEIIEATVSTFAAVLPAKSLINIPIKGKIAQKSSELTTKLAITIPIKKALNITLEYSKFNNPKLDEKIITSPFTISKNINCETNNIHIVKAGECMSKIAKDNNISISKLQELNKIKDINTINSGQILKLK